MNGEWKEAEIVDILKNSENKTFIYLTDRGMYNFLIGEEFIRERGIDALERFNLMVGKIVRHFKGGEYLVIGDAIQTETGERLVIYKSINGDKKTYARPFKMFLSEVDHKKYPDVKQKYRLEIVEHNEGDR